MLRGVVHHFRRVHERHVRQVDLVADVVVDHDGHHVAAAAAVQPERLFVVVVVVVRVAHELVERLAEEVVAFARRVLHVVVVIAARWRDVPVRVRSERQESRRSCF